MFATLCIANMVIEYQEVRDDPNNWDLSGADVFQEVLKKYWASFIGAFIATLFSIFVFGLCGFHTYLVNVALTTQEKLKGVYNQYPESPFSHGRCFANWRKVILWPKVSKTRLYHILFLKC